MKLCSALVLLLLPSLVFSQAPRKTVKSKTRYLLEQYEVLSTNDTIRSGSYRKYFRDGAILLEEGQYDNNRRVGSWTFYNSKGGSELVYDYSANKILTNNRTGIDSMGTIQIEGKNTLVRLDPPPTYLASSHQVSGILVRESRLPVHLQRAGTSQLAYQVVATVSQAGVHYRVIPSHSDKVFYQNAQQATALAFKNVQWLPGVYQDQEVTAIYMLPTIYLQGFAVIR